MSLLLTLERPLVILMVIPIMISIHLTSITYVRVISIMSVLLFALGNIILLNKEYEELWIIVVYIFLYFIFQFKHIFPNDIKESEFNINEENLIFNKLFLDDFNEEEFRNILLKHATIKRLNKRRKLFTAEGGPFDKIYLFVTVPKNALITLKHQKMVISYIKDGSWIGVVEFITQLFDDSQRKWMIGIEADNPTEEEIVWMEWEKDYFHKLFKKYKASSFLKRLLSCWVKYLSISIYKMDDHVATALGVITHKKFEHFTEALPLFRYRSSTSVGLNEVKEESDQKPLLEVNEEISEP